MRQSLSWINDTLRGKLYAYETDEDKPNRHRFGYWHNIEHRMIRDQLIAEGHDPKSREFQSLVRNRSDKNHENDISLRDYQEAWKAVIDHYKTDKTPQQFTKEELLFLINHFERANSPEAIAIRDKAKVMYGS